MLHEYALDPSVLTNWQSFRYFFENFGVSEGRLIARYPKKWKKMVLEACSGCREVEKLKIVERLKEVNNEDNNKLIPSPCLFDPTRSWLANAEANRGAFRAVISTTNPSGHDNVLVADEIQGNDPLWMVEREKPIARTARTMADCAGKLLAHAKEILFVDPHFNPSKDRYLNTLKAFLQKIPVLSEVKRIEYHLSLQKDDYYAKKFVEDISKKRLSSVLGHGTTITFIRWQEKSAGGDSLHPRYILTELGGIRFEHGLDEEPGGPTADVSLLEAGLYKTRWNDYQKDTTSFVYVDEFVVTGTR